MIPAGIDFRIRSFAASAVVFEYAGGRVVDVAVFPIFIGHPEIFYHMTLGRIIFFEQFAIQERFFCKRFCVCVFGRQLFKLLIGVETFRIFFQVINERVSDSVRKSRFLSVQYAVRKITAFKSLSQKIFSDTVGIELLFGV